MTASTNSIEMDDITWALIYFSLKRNQTSFFLQHFQSFFFNTLKEMKQITNIICYFQNEYIHMMKRVFFQVLTRWKL